MIDPELLEILCCPETRQDITLAKSEELAAFNQAVTQGRVKNRAGVAVTEPADDLLIRVDRKVAYVVRDAIPVMLIDEGVSLDGIIS